METNPNAQMPTDPTREDHGASDRVRTVVTGWADSVIRYLLAGLVSVVLFMGKWAVSTEQRVHDLEVRIVSLESAAAAGASTAAALNEVHTELALVQAQLAAQDKAQTRIESLLERLAGPR